MGAARELLKDRVPVRRAVRERREVCWIKETVTVGQMTAIVDCGVRVLCMMSGWDPGTWLLASIIFCVCIMMHLSKRARHCIVRGVIALDGLYS
jgi:hypothetical protein